MTIETEESIGSTSFVVRVIPRSSKTETVGELDGALKIRLKSPPVDGADNNELIRFLSQLLDVPKINIEIVAGATSRTKRIQVNSEDPSRIAAVLRAKI